MIEKNEPIDWKAAYRLPFECTKISKLRVFQFKLLHRRLATNDFLKKKIKLRDNDLCNFCQIEEETLIHLFWNCTGTSCFWHNFRLWLLKNETSVRPDPSWKAVRPITFAKKCWSFCWAIGAHRRLWSCTNSSVSLQKLWVRTAFLTGPDPNFSVV